jgi:CHAT domain-containing protein
LKGGFLMLSGDTPGSGFLTAGEVQRMRLGASLAVLSACQSGLGMLHDGGVIGLSRSFQKAGVPRVVMSLWSVDDEATLAMMGRFQHHLMKDAPAVALRKAMLETRANFREPRYWAAFMLFGTPR